MTLSFLSFAASHPRTLYLVFSVIIDFTLNYLPRHSQRTRFLKILVWCMPERAQQVGAMVYRAVDAINWERLRCDVPSIVPRGIKYWKRYY